MAFQNEGIEESGASNTQFTDWVIRITAPGDRNENVICPWKRVEIDWKRGMGTSG